MFEWEALLRSRGHEVMIFSMRHPENLPSRQERFFLERVRFDADQPPSARLRAAAHSIWSREAAERLTRAAQGRRRARHRAPAFLHVPAHAGHPRAARRARRADRPDLPRLRAHLRQPAPLQPSREPHLRGMPPARAAGAALDALHERLLRRRAPPVAPPVARTRSSAAARSKVRRFITPSEFMRRKMIEGGLPARRVFHERHFIRPDWIAPSQSPGDYILFMGRLVPQKGNRDIPRCRGAHARSAVQSRRDRRAGAGRAGARARGEPPPRRGARPPRRTGNSRRSCAARARWWCLRSGTSRSRLLSLRRWRRRGR